MRLYVPLAVIGVAVISALFIIAWGLDDNEDVARDGGLLQFPELIGGTSSPSEAGDLLDEFMEFQARNAEEIRVAADDLLDWANSDTGESDALHELFVSCDSVPPPQRMFGADDSALDGPAYERSVGAVCYGVHQGVTRRTADDWANTIRTEIPVEGYPYTAAGRLAIEAQINRLRAWAENVLSARELDTDYAIRFCARGLPLAFGIATSPPVDDADAEHLVDQLIDFCSAAEGSAASPTDLAERVTVEFAKVPD